MQGPDPTILEDLIKVTMPFGKYKGTIISRLPMHYLEWMIQNRAVPNGRMGMLIHTIYEIKLNNLEYLLSNMPRNPSQRR